MAAPYNVPQPVDFDDADVRKEWAEAFEISELQLLEAAAIVGHMPRALTFYLRSKAAGRRVLLTAADRARSAAQKKSRILKRGAPRLR